MLSVTSSTVGGIHSIVTTLIATYTLRIPFPSLQTTQVNAARCTSHHLPSFCGHSSSLFAVPLRCLLLHHTKRLLPVVVLKCYSNSHYQSRRLGQSPCSAGYKFNITFLRNFLAPIYEIHDIKQNPDNEFEILSRWSFSMQFWWLRYLPFIKVTFQSMTSNPAQF